MRNYDEGREFRKRLIRTYNEGTSLAFYPVLKNLIKGKSIEIPSLDLFLHPDGSVTKTTLDKQVEFLAV